VNRRKAAGLALLLWMLTGCAGTTAYLPRATAPGELTLGYDDGFVMQADGRPVAEGYRWENLEPYVSCVPEAREHASQASSSGTRAVVLSWMGGAFAVGGLGGLSGLAFTERAPQLAASLVLGGLALEVVGLTLAIVGYDSKASANGHAVDAMNFYNDARLGLGPCAP